MSGEHEGSVEELSPYQVVLGRELHGLHPRLRRYFAAIPTGHRGFGEGVWDRVGTPRRWLRPFLRLLGREGIAFAEWGQGVPFSVVNTPASAEGMPSVEARRTFQFTSGSRVMTDSIGVEGGVLVDRLGRSRSLHSRLEMEVVGGELRMRSTALHVRLGSVLLRVPGWGAPRVALTERFDDDRSRQHVASTLDMPLLGRIYEYSGYFDYRIEAIAER